MVTSSNNDEDGLRNASSVTYVEVRRRVSEPHGDDGHQCDVVGVEAKFREGRRPAGCSI